MECACALLLFPPFPKGKANNCRYATQVRDNATAVATPHPPSSMVRPSPRGRHCFRCVTSRGRHIIGDLTVWAHLCVRPKKASLLLKANLNMTGAHIGAPLQYYNTTVPLRYLKGKALSHPSIKPPSLREVGFTEICRFR